jgi:hypothetical protein
MMAKKEATKVPITERALIQRINRKLQQENYGVMKIAREGSRAEQNLGRYYVVNDRNTVIDWHLKLEEYGRDWGVLAPYEKLVTE